MKRSGTAAPSGCVGNQTQLCNRTGHRTYKTDVNGNTVSQTGSGTNSSSSATAKQSPSTGDTSKDADQSSDSQTSEKGKEFYTIQTASEKVFYLVIDRDGEDEKVYFLTEVSETTC